MVVCQDLAKQIFYVLLTNKANYTHIHILNECLYNTVGDF